MNEAQPASHLLVSKRSASVIATKRLQEVGLALNKRQQDVYGTLLQIVWFAFCTLDYYIPVELFSRLMGVPPEVYITATDILAGRGQMVEGDHFKRGVCAQSIARDAPAEWRQSASGLVFSAQGVVMLLSSDVKQGPLNKVQREAIVVVLQSFAAHLSEIKSFIKNRPTADQMRIYKNSTDHFLDVVVEVGIYDSRPSANGAYGTLVKQFTMAMVGMSVPVSKRQDNQSELMLELASANTLTRRWLLSKEGEKFRSKKGLRDLSADCTRKLISIYPEEFQGNDAESQKRRREVMCPEESLLAKQVKFVTRSKRTAQAHAALQMPPPTPMHEAFIPDNLPEVVFHAPIAPASVNMATSA